MPDRVKPVISNFWHPGTLTLSPERQSARMPKITNDRLNPVRHKMLYSCTHVATVNVKGLSFSFLFVCSRVRVWRRMDVDGRWSGGWAVCYCCCCCCCCCCRWADGWRRQWRHVMSNYWRNSLTRIARLPTLIAVLPVVVVACLLLLHSRVASCRRVHRLRPALVLVSALSCILLFAALKNEYYI